MPFCAQRLTVFGDTWRSSATCAVRRYLGSVGVGTNALHSGSVKGVFELAGAGLGGGGALLQLELADLDGGGWVLVGVVDPAAVATGVEVLDGPDSLAVSVGVTMVDEGGQVTVELLEGQLGSGRRVSGGRLAHPPVG
jgi:hypothetical protein